MPQRHLAAAVQLACSGVEDGPIDSATVMTLVDSLADPKVDLRAVEAFTDTLADDGFAAARAQMVPLLVEMVVARFEPILIWELAAEITVGPYQTIAADLLPRLQAGVRSPFSDAIALLRGDASGWGKDPSNEKFLLGLCTRGAPTSRLALARTAANHPNDVWVKVLTERMRQGLNYLLLAEEEQAFVEQAIARGQLRNLLPMAELFTPEALRRLLAASDEADASARPTGVDPAAWQKLGERAKAIPRLPAASRLMSYVHTGVLGEHALVQGLFVSDPLCERFFFTSLSGNAFALHCSSGNLPPGQSVHDGLAFDMVAADGGRRVLTAGDSGDCVVAVWNTRSGLPERLLTGHDSYILCIGASPVEPLAATGSPDHSVRVWNVRTGRCRHVLRGHSDNVTGVAFSKDGRYLASLDIRGVVTVWDPVTGQALRSSRTGSGSYQIAWSPNGADRLLLLNEEDGSLCTLDEDGPQPVTAADPEIRRATFLEGGFIWEKRRDNDVHRVRRLDGGLVTEFSQPDVQRLALAAKGGLLLTHDRQRVVTVRSSSGTILQTITGCRQACFHADPLSVIVHDEAEDRVVLYRPALYWFQNATLAQHGKAMADVLPEEYAGNRPWSKAEADAISFQVAAAKLLGGGE